MANNKVVFGNEILMDLTEDTVTEDKVLEGETFHDRSGVLRSGSLVIPVQDVEVNGESVVDPTTKIAEITSYEEVTQAEYDNMPSSKESDKVLYMVYSDGQILDPNYSYHKYGNNDEIIVRVYHEGQSDQQTLWFFRGWNQSSEIMDIPSSLIAYAPSDISRPVASISFTDNTGATQNGWIGFYSNNIRIWSQDWALYITGIMYGVVDPEGAGYPNPQTNPYIDDPYIYVHDPSVRSARRIYLNGREYAEFNIPTTDIQTAVDEFETYNGGLLSALKVSLTPNQDLHGYPEPWVGGAGKNKLPNTATSVARSGVTLTVYSDGTVIGNGTATNIVAVAYENVALNGEYILNGCPSGGGSGTYELQIVTATATYRDYGDGVTFTANGNFPVQILIRQGATLNNAVFKPMIRLATESDPTFEPYSNICPISGHTQVDVDVSDGQTTQEQVTVNLGGTYYSGTLDVVSGVLTVDKASVVFDGSENWQIYPSDTSAFFFVTVSTMTSTSWSYVLSEVFKDVYRETDARNNDCSIWSRYQQIHIHAPSSIVPSGISNEGLAEFKTWLSNNPQKVIYKLATPTPIQLSPTMVKALVGENHLSAPLDGQEITESKYKQMFTFDDVNTQIESTYSEGISHNSVYRGKYLGDHVTDEQWDAIGDGSFRDLYIGDYWTINGINWRIAHFNYWLGTGDVKCNTNHVVIVPYGWVSTFNMNATDDTTGGYLNSKWYTTNRHFAVENIEADFGASHILSHRNFFSDAVSDGHASHGMWVDSTVDLMNEIMVCGSLVGSYSGKYYEVGCDKFQLALFKYNPPSIRMDVSYWLRGVSTESSFVAMGSFGLLDGFTASQILKIRPVFGIKA